MYLIRTFLDSLIWLHCVFTVGPHLMETSKHYFYYHTDQYAFPVTYPGAFHRKHTHFWKEIIFEWASWCLLVRQLFYKGKKNLHFVMCQIITSFPASFPLRHLPICSPFAFPKSACTSLTPGFSFSWMGKDEEESNTIHAAEHCRHFWSSLFKNMYISPSSSLFANLIVKNIKEYRFLQHNVFLYFLET